MDRPVVESHPTTTNRLIDRAVQSSIDKIDLLFMVDNSASMADKQEILRDAVPVLLTRLTSPICVDPVTRAPTGGTSPCTVGEPEFNAVKDIHVGIVTSSLGAHGGNQCPTKAGFTPDDKAHLLGTVRPTGSNPDPKLVFDSSRTWNNSGFLAWDEAKIDQPPGTSDPMALKESFQDMVVASGEQGCGFEAQLESWYRFLVDPEPPANVTRDMAARPQTVRGSALIQNADGTTTCNGCDQDLLAQRKAFLRPDSLVAIVMLTDENDCSVRDDSVGWFVTTTSDSSGAPVNMPRSTTACATNPNDPCCRSCADQGAPAAGCGVTADDPVCKATPNWDGPHDSPNLRCFDQKRRFGFDLLYPASRYVDALTQPTLTLQSDGKTQVPNPLYAPDPKLGTRPTDRVFLAGIVGVPWQDVADDASLTGPGLKYLSAKELTDKNRWSVLLGDPEASPPVPASDPFMRESIAARAGTNPITNDAIQPADSMNPQANRINGHEQNVPGLDDLQYACTFKLKTPKQCVAGASSCDCEPDGPSTPDRLAAANRPLCQPVAGGAPTTQQTFAKAYPGTRELQVLKGLVDQGIVASICPKVTELSAGADPATDSNYGYNPAVAAIIDRLRGKLQGNCLPRGIETDPDTHQALCTMIEAQAEGCGNCSAQGRAPADPALAEAVRRELKNGGYCDGPSQPACSTFCQCEIKQEEGPNLEACRQNKDVPAGYCYVDDPASPLVASCPVNEKRLLRFVGGTDGLKTPAPGAVAFIACVGAAIETSSAQ
ncbi:MAG: hypothetical protein ABUL62_32720 [Myxococcales bacterium]